MFKRNLLLLASCQGLMLSCTSLTIATSALVGVTLAPTPALATLPLGLAYLCIMMTMIPVDHQWHIQPTFCHVTLTCVYAFCNK